jgi:type II secretory ATPase GspE/PulE/Tfp pilus assembly ATPase PilB-like protein
MGIEPFLIASTVTIVVAQRLVRKLCNSCKRAYIPDAGLLKKIGISESEARSAHFFMPVGCEECSGTGYRGRLAIFEIMKMSPALVQLTLARADTGLMQEQSRKDGMILLVEDGARKAKEGLTTIEEVLAAATL